MQTDQCAHPIQFVAPNSVRRGLVSKDALLGVNPTLHSCRQPQSSLSGLLIVAEQKLGDSRTDELSFNRCNNGPATVSAGVFTGRKSGENNQNPPLAPTQRGTEHTHRTSR